MANQVVHFEIIGRDGKKLQQFYSDLFGWQVDANNPMDYGMVRPGGDQGVGGGIAASQDGGAGYVTIYVEVDDLQAHLDKAVAMGGQVVMPATDVPGGPTIAMFTDPDGHLIGLTKAGTMNTA